MKKGAHQPTYRSWQMMKNRCGNPNCKDYERYGGRGIFYPHAWETYEGFVADMGQRPEGLTLERIKGDLGYSKSNCRWASRLDQSRNREYTRDLTFHDRTMKVWEWAAELNLSPKTMHHRLWQLDNAMMTVEQVFRPRIKGRRHGME
ncbi:MAG: hypothetical protein JSS14_22190 [Proteobacteria bacterium]|nr:hypothetical protein [Pseudomonadota bacterium]